MGEGRIWIPEQSRLSRWDFLRMGAEAAGAAALATGLDGLVAGDTSVTPAPCCTGPTLP